MEHKISLFSPNVAQLEEEINQTEIDRTEIDQTQVIPTTKKRLHPSHQENTKRIRSKDKDEEKSETSQSIAKIELSGDERAVIWRELARLYTCIGDTDLENSVMMKWAEDVCQTDSQSQKDNDITLCTALELQIENQHSEALKFDFSFNIFSLYIKKKKVYRRHVH